MTTTSMTERHPPPVTGLASFHQGQVEVLMGPSSSARAVLWFRWCLAYSGAVHIRSLTALRDGMVKFDVELMRPLSLRDFLRFVPGVVKFEEAAGRTRRVFVQVDDDGLMEQAAVRLRHMGIESRPANHD